MEMPFSIAVTKISTIIFVIPAQALAGSAFDVAATEIISPGTEPLKEAVIAYFLVNNLRLLIVLLRS